MAAEADKTKSRWQKFTLSDVVLFLYWTAFFVSFCIVFNSPLDFREALSLTTPVRKFAVLICFWVGSIVVGQSIFGFKGLLRKMWHFVVSPLTALQVLTGFWMDTWKLFKRTKKQVPWSYIFWSLLVLLPLLTWFDNDPNLLSFLLIPNWILLFWLIGKSFQWSLNPLPFVGDMKFSEDKLHIKRKVVGSMATVTVKKGEDPVAKMLKSLNDLKMFALGAPKLLDFLNSPKTLFFLFLGIFAFVGVGSIVYVTGILRILQITTSGGIFSGTGFSGEFLDYLYIVLCHFSGGEMYHIDLLSDSVRYVLVALPFIALVLTVLLILAFGLFFQTKMDKTAKDAKKSISDLVEEAVEAISADRRVVIEQPKAPVKKSNVVVDAENLNAKIEVHAPVLNPTSSST